MRVLGLDPGSRRTGWGVVERRGTRCELVAFGQVLAPATLGLPERLYAIAGGIGEVLDEHHPDCVAVEEAFYQKSVRSTLVLGHVRGALLVLAIGRGCAVAEYSPRTIKLAVTGTGAAAKEQVAFMVRRVLSITGDLPIDASDGLAVALCHVQRGGRAPEPRRRSRGATLDRATLEALLARRVRA